MIPFTPKAIPKGMMNNPEKAHIQSRLFPFRQSSIAPMTANPHKEAE